MGHLTAAQRTFPGRLFGALALAISVAAGSGGCAEAELTGQKPDTATPDAGDAGGLEGGGGVANSGGGSSGTGSTGTGGTAAGGVAGAAAGGGTGGVSGAATGGNAGAPSGGSAGVGSGGSAGVGGVATGGGGTGGVGTGGVGTGGVSAGGAASGGSANVGGGGGVAGCVDFATQVQALLSSRCTSCHSGTTPPQNLNLESYAGVLKGGDTGNEVIACKPTASLIYQKISMATPPVGVQMPADGPPYLSQGEIDTVYAWIQQGARPNCAAPDPCVDTKAPAFAGLVSATLSASKLGVDLCWAAGTDDTTPQSQLLYDIYEATSPGGQVYSAPSSATSAAGATCMNLEGLTPGQQYCYVVRARDGAGNRDGNTLEKCVTIPAAACVDFATMVLPIFKGECTSCHSGASPPQNLKLDSYSGVIAGGLTGNEVVACQPSSSLLYQKITMSKPPVGAQMPLDGPPYLTPAQIDIIKKWIEEGARSSCSQANPCSNTTPPTFGGLTTATAQNATSAKLCWNAASDDVTPAANIVYDVYEATAPGGQNFSAAPTTSSAPGALCVDIDALSPQSQYCWVVRARDGAGNRDANLVQKCLTMPALPPGCVDYSSMVQPIFDKFCVHCHSSPLPPQWLRLDSYEGVIAGGARRNEVDACNPAGSLLISKVGANPSVGKRMPYDGPPYLSATQIALLSQWVQNGAQRNCSVPAACADATPPSFGGITSAAATDPTHVKLCWNAATDAGTKPADMKYDVYEATTSGGQAFSQPPQETVVGQTCIDVTTGPGKPLCFVVRARDLADNRDSNQVQLCVTPPASACAVEYDSMVQPILSARCTFCHSGNAPGHFLGLKSYADVLAGGSLRNEVKACDWPNSLINLKTSGAVCGARMPRDGPPWLAPSERALLEAWVASGARKSCSEPATCGDSVKPVFAGATSAQAVDADTVRVCWNAAVDDKTPASGITYLVYESALPGGQQLTAPAPYAIAGATCIDLPSPVSSQTCYVVRARDLTGNTDTNTAQVCTTTPAGCFDYASNIQPIFTARCTHCHGGSNPAKGISWESYQQTINTGDVMACNPGSGKLLEMIETCQMPRDTTSQCSIAKACLTPNQQRMVRQWISNGADQYCPWGC